MERPRIVIIGAGFAGFECARRLERHLHSERAQIVLVSPSSYMLYLPLLPQVAAGMLTPQSTAVPLRRTLRRSTILAGGAIGVDLDAKVVVVKKITGELTDLRYDRLVVTPGSITRAFNIPGLDQYARGMKTLAEATYLRDHVIAQLELASTTTDPAEREARLRFVVVGGGYTGVETAATLQLLTQNAAKHFPQLSATQMHWHLIDIAPRLMPELGGTLGDTAEAVLRRRGVEISLETSVSEVTENTVTFTDGRVLPCRSLIWTAGVAPSPLIETMGVETVRGRVAVGTDLAVPGRPGVFALGDAAAVPDVTKSDGAVCPPTAQHAQRQGIVAAHNVVASLGGAPYRHYRHKDLGLVVDLGGPQAVANPMGVQMTGLPAQLVTRGYHLMAMGSGRSKARVMANWLLNATAGDDFVRMGFINTRTASLADFEYTDHYLTREEISARIAAMGQPTR